MAWRLGVGATAVAAVAFSVLLASNLVLFAAAGDRALLYSRANAADALGDQAAALVGAVGMDALLQVQSDISMGAFNCSTASAAIAGLVSGLPLSERSGSLTVLGAAGIAPAVDSADEYSMLAPFNGSVRGELNIVLHLAVRGEDPFAGVSLSTNETHLVHLPVRWAAAVSDCLRAVDWVRFSVASTHVPNCTSQAVLPVLSGLGDALATAEAADGFRSGLTYATVGQSPCTVAFSVSIEQDDIQGPGGGFSLRLEGDSTASFA